MVIQAILHTDNEQKKVDNLAKRTDNKNSLIGTKLLLDTLEIGQKVGFRLIVREIVGFNNNQELIWNGKLSSVEFLVKVPVNYSLNKIWVSLIVLKDNNPIGNFTFSIKVSKTNSNDRESVAFRPYYYSPLNNQTELRKNFCNYGDGKNSTGN